MIRLYDTLTGHVRPLEQRDEGKVSLYACGPTVYDHPHLGHARQALTYDIVRRYLEWTGVDVHHVANVTDIDDNIINRANREGSTEPEIAATWKAVYDEAMDALDILRPHDRPHATEYVEEMVAFIETLVANGAAYATDSGVYLRVHAVPGYGDLVHRSVDELRDGAGARVEVDDHKEDPLDFALWKAAKAGEPTWPSPWGPGRPGWHIECVAMSLDVLGDGFDLHGGGTDLVFPHHTNERAEAVAAGQEFARHWMHSTDAQHRRREDEQVARQLHDDRGSPRRTPAQRPGPAAPPPADPLPQDDGDQPHGHGTSTSQHRAARRR
ncbi:MAG: class I tRNA ligase family protein [Acidimicrobiales bacterium]